MSPVSPESGLPRVREDDILTVSVDDIMHPDHRHRWDRFAREQPELARELLAIAGTTNTDEPLLEVLTRGKASLDLITFVYSALMRAQERLRAQEDIRPVGMDPLPFDQPDEPLEPELSPPVATNPS